MRVSLRHVPAGFATDSGATPAYACDKYGLPPICKESQKHNEIRSICSNFYKSLQPGEHKVICPIGINISYLKTNNAPNPMAFFLQTGFNPETHCGNVIKNLNRIPKKAIKNALKTTQSFRFSSSIDESKTLNLWRRTLETLFAGRVAASMRILTHQILTPVQGAMSDLEEIKHKHKIDKYNGDEKPLILLEANIDEINSFAKQIHVLLSEDIEPSPQRIRKVTVHNVIKNICGRLESVATKKDLMFNSNYNNGIKVVEAVPDQIVIVFKCLLDNAAKYSFAGKHEWKRKINIYYDDTRVNDVRTLKVSIQSYGCPITSDEIRERKIFELGYRGEFSGDRGRQGTGSGLYIADRIINAHYGKIEVESRIEESSTDDLQQALNTFTVFWPRFFPEEIA